MNPHLSSVTDFLTTEVLPHANQIDTNPDLLFQALQGLGRLGILTLKVDRNFGGQGVSDLEYGQIQTAIARCSGALAFVQAQHQSAAAMLAASLNNHLKNQYLSAMTTGDILVGVGFSHLRRRGHVAVKATSVSGGYLIDGRVPWITGWHMFNDFIVAATLDDGRVLFGMLPLNNCQQSQGGSLELSDPAELMAMPATNTVSAQLNNWYLPQEQVVFIQPPDFIENNDRKNVLKAAFFIFGCAEAGLSIIAENYQKKQLNSIQLAHNQLQQELNQCRQKIESAIAQPQSSSYHDKLELRSWAINLMHRISQAALTTSSGAANYLHHRAQRIYREALVFSVTGQTNDIMAATLAKLTAPPINHSRIIHLSHVIDSNIPQWTGDPVTKFTTVSEIAEQGYFLRQLTIGEHSATHINAPRSFSREGTTIDTYPAAKFILPAATIDITHLVTNNPDYLLTVADIQAWENQHGQINPETLVLLNTGWSQKWHHPAQFMNADNNQTMHFPGFSLDACKFLVTQRNIAGIGIDTHGVDGGNSSDFSVNRFILSQPRIVLENLTNLQELPPLGTIIAIAPLRLRGGSGSPVGVLGIIQNIEVYPMYKNI